MYFILREKKYGLFGQTIITTTYHQHHRCFSDGNAGLAWFLILLSCFILAFISVPKSPCGWLLSIQSHLNCHLYQEVFSSSSLPPFSIGLSCFAFFIAGFTAWKYLINLNIHLFIFLLYVFPSLDCKLHREEIFVSRVNSGCPPSPWLSTQFSRHTVSFWSHRTLASDGFGGDVDVGKEEGKA